MNPEFMELFQSANADWDSLSPRDQGAVNAVYSATLMIFQETFAQRESGSIADDLSRNFDTTIVSMLQLPGMATWYERFGKHFCAPSLTAYLDRLLDAGEVPPIQNWAPWYVGADDSERV